MQIGCGLFGVLKLRSRDKRLIYGGFRARFCSLSLRKSDENTLFTNGKKGVFVVCYAHTIGFPIIILFDTFAASYNIIFCLCNLKYNLTFKASV